LLLSIGKARHKEKQNSTSLSLLAVGVQIGLTINKSMDSRPARLAVKHTVLIQLVGNQWVAHFHRSRDKFDESKWRICKYQGHPRWNFL
jgi:hypothetical protein